MGRISHRAIYKCLGLLSMSLSIEMSFMVTNNARFARFDETKITLTERTWCLTWILCTASCDAGLSLCMQCGNKIRFYSFYKRAELPHCYTSTDKSRQFTRISHTTISYIVRCCWFTIWNLRRTRHTSWKWRLQNGMNVLKWSDVECLKLDLIYLFIEINWLSENER